MSLSTVQASACLVSVGVVLISIALLCTAFLSAFGSAMGTVVLSQSVLLMIFMILRIKGRQSKNAYSIDNLFGGYGRPEAGSMDRQAAC